MVAAFTNVHVCARLGTGGTFVLGASCQILAYALISWKPPYPLFVISFFFSGLGVAYQDAQANTMISGVNNAHRWLGLLHAVYGFGALVSPLIATSIAAHTPYWHYYYLITLGLGAINLGLLAYTFRKGLFKSNSDTAVDTASRELKQALSQRSVWILSIFFFLYVGAEVTAGGMSSLPILRMNLKPICQLIPKLGWVVEFLVSVRKGVPSKVGYVASGFWGGLTVGRVVLADVTFKLGEQRMIFVYLGLALSMQLMFWFIPNIIANAVVVSLLGIRSYRLSLLILTLIRRLFHCSLLPCWNLRINEIAPKGAACCCHWFGAPLFPTGTHQLTISRLHIHNRPSRFRSLPILNRSCSI
jgi:fucose permease